MMNYIMCGMLVFIIIVLLLIGNELTAIEERIDQKIKAINMITTEFVIIHPGELFDVKEMRN